MGLASTGSRRDTLGVLVMFVDDNGPAARAGIEEGNRIASMNDVDLRAAHEDAGDDFVGTTKVRRLQREISALHAGDNVDLRVYANGEYRTVRLRAGRASDSPHRGRTFIITGEGTKLGAGAFPLGFDGALMGDQVRRALEQAMDNTGRALEGLGRGFGRMQLRDNDFDLPDIDATPRAPRARPIEPVEPIHIEPLEPSRLRHAAPPKVPFATALLDDSSITPPTMAAAALADGMLPRQAPPAALDIAGLQLVAVGSELASYLGKGSERGLLVVEVPEWARRSLRSGDVVLAVDGTPVRSNDGADDITIALPRYREAQLDILRDSVHHSVTLPARR